MSVELDPSVQLTFTRPFNQMVKEVLTIRNNNAFAVVFKVKTTTPRQYCVRPNAGRISPGESVQVQVVLQPIREELPADYKCRDKFLVQSVAVTPEREHLSPAEMWQLVERDAKHEINERKLRCAYLMPSDSSEALGSAAAGDTSLQNADDASSIKSTSRTMSMSGSVPILDKAAANDDVMVSSLQRELREAKAAIRQLKDRNERQQRELNEAHSVARQRRTMDAGRTGTKTKQDGLISLPLQTIIAIVITSFFIGYWFF